MFQKKLIDQPLMENVLADLALELEAATALTFRLARAYDEDDEAAQVIRRVVTPAAKFWICKRTPYVTYEAMEVLGGSGYIEESIMPRLYREAPVNSIWEGSGNVMCLDVLRAIARTPGAAEVLAKELDAGDKRLSAFTERLQKRLQASERNDELQARALTRELVLGAAGSASDQARAGAGGGRLLRLAARWRQRRLRPVAARARSQGDRGAGGACNLRRAPGMRAQREARAPLIRGHTELPNLAKGPGLQRTASALRTRDDGRHHSFPNTASTSAACARKPTTKQSVRSTGMPAQKTTTCASRAQK